jgi:ADP-ribose pyrophosphatase YjhB (NUDIX family)
MKKGIDYIGVTVCFYCHDGKGNLLLQKRSHKCRDEQGMWDCGGGSMRFGETFEEAARREIKEEYCCELEHCF